MNSSVNEIPDWVTQEIFESICTKEVPNFSKITKFTAEPGIGAGENYASIILRVLIECELKVTFCDQKILK
uniref:Uncharacterized protein n=1 Tax=Megaselia scalaris TaxID=36166 RepID=T1GKA5_MEGSC